MSAIEEPDEDTVAEVTKLKADYRRSCARNAAGRRTSGGVRVITETVTEDVVAEEEIIPAEPEEQATQPDPVVETDENVDSEITLEQELANLDTGLCADGSQPNRFGCCGDEIFKDLGNTVFACCPKEGGDCFPPLK